MNIALVIDSLRPGGSEGVVARLASGLARRGVNVILYCLDRSRRDLNDLTASGVRVREAHTQPRDPSVWLRLADWLRRDRIDLVHAHSCSGLVASFPAAKLLGLPIINVRHGWPPGRRARHTLIADWLAPWIDQVVINAESGREKLRSPYVRRKAIHIPNGLDVSSSGPAEASAMLETICQRRLPKPVIMTIANLRREKGIRPLLRGFAILREQHPTASLVIVGRRLDEYYAKQVDADVDAFHLADSVHFVGAVPEAQRLLPAADIYCLSSTHEAMPNVVLEAMAHRVPIVATAIGDVGRLDETAADSRWILHDQVTALLANPNDPQTLADALHQTLSDPKAAQLRARRAYERYQNEYRTSTMVTRYAELYERLLSHRPRHAAPQRKATVAHLGPPTNERGGMVTSIRLLMESQAGQSTRRIRLSNAPSQSNTPGWAIYNHAAALCRLTRTLLTQPVDVLHIHTCSGLTFWRNSVDAAIARLLGVNVVWHIRGGKFPAFCEATTGWRRRLLRLALSEADRVITLSHAFAERLRAVAPGARITTIPNAFDPAIETSSEPEPIARTDDTCRFVYLATLRRGKGIHELLAATELLKQRHVKFEVVLLGDMQSEERRQLDAKINSDAPGNPIRWLGSADLAMKHKWLAWADVFVHPSHSEGLPNAVLEAAASGLPVIATDVGATRDVLQPDPLAAPLAVLIPPRDANALADAMQTLAEDAPQRQQIAAAISAHVRANYHIERISREINAVYATLLGPRFSFMSRATTCADNSPPKSPPTPATAPTPHHSDQWQMLAVSGSS